MPDPEAWEAITSDEVAARALSRSRVGLEPYRPAVEPARVRSFEFLESCVMVTTYRAERPGEVGNVGLLWPGPRANTRPGGSAMR